LAFLAFSLVLAGISMATGFISGAWGTGRTIALGMALNGLSFLILIFSGTTVSLAMVLLALVLGGAGQSLAYNTSTAVAMAAVPSAKAGAASGTIGSIRILAVAVGVAVTTSIFKAFGYIKEFPVEKFWRDSKLLTIGEGTSEVQRMVTARHILTEFA
jgi:MFS family permease